MTARLVALRRIARLRYGDALSSDERSDGSVVVYGSNGPVGRHHVANSTGPAIVVGRKGSYGKVSWSATPVFAIDTAFYIDGRSTAAHLRWLYYVLQTLELDAGSRDSAVPGLERKAAHSRLVPVLHLAEQRAIADFLDRETRRIDALIEKKERTLALFKERQARAFVDALVRRGVIFPNDLESDWKAVVLQPGWRIMHLSQTLIQLTNGYVGPTRDILVDDGIRYVQSLHIKGGTIDFSRRPFFVEASWHYDRPRIHLRAGDVLIVQTGDIGQVAVVPEGFGEASCHALQIARVRPDVLTGEYLGAYLRSPFGYQSLLCRATGALHPHLEGSIKKVPVIVPPKMEQAEIVADVRRDQAGLQAISEKLASEIRLLEERRHALITAAVTGQLGIPEAA